MNASEPHPSHDNLVDRLGDVLLARGKLTAADLARARAASDIAGNRLDRTLVELGIITEAGLLDLLRDPFQVDDFGPASLPEGPLLPQIAPRFWSAARMVPLAMDDVQITLGMVDALDDFSAQAVALKLRRRALRMRITSAQLESSISRAAEDEADNVAPLAMTAAKARADDVQLLREAATDAPVVRLVQGLLREAVQRNASDIHLRPTRNGGGEIMLRLSGELVQTGTTPADLLPGIISRLKILADLDISERRRPQDGRINANVGGRLIDVRISTMPNIEGEGAVLRLLGREGGHASLAELGFSEAISQGLQQLYEADNGLILVTGPTGSGKTTTQHSALRQLIRPGVNVVTIEDPVEYRLDGASQVQIDEKVGLSFPVVLRSLLRQDPDVIFVGEIRDGETAKIAVQAALTGHLVLATLHTNSAPDAVPRLIDMGVEPYLLAAVLRGVLSQRLMRRPCPHCGIKHAGRAGGPDWLDIGPGCDHCAGTGHQGRTAVGELLLLDAGLTNELSRPGLSAAETKALLVERGYIALQDDIVAAADDGRIAASDAWGVQYG